MPVAVKAAKQMGSSGIGHNRYPMDLENSGVAQFLLRIKQTKISSCTTAADSSASARTPPPRGPCAGVGCGSDLLPELRVCTALYRLRALQRDGTSSGQMTAAAPDGLILGRGAAGGGAVRAGSEAELPLEGWGFGSGSCGCGRGGGWCMWLGGTRD